MDIKQVSIFVRCKCGEFLKQIEVDKEGKFIEVTVEPCWWCVKKAKEYVEE